MAEKGIRVQKNEDRERISFRRKFVQSRDFGSGQRGGGGGSEGGLHTDEPPTIPVVARPDVEGEQTGVSVLLSCPDFWGLFEGDFFTVVEGEGDGACEVFDGGVELPGGGDGAIVDFGDEGAGFQLSTSS